MELRVLKYFLMVAREENITKAAALLHITQPTLSRQLMQLEEELGVKLFHRSKHSIILTEDGMLLKRRAQELVFLSDKTIQELSHKGPMLSGEIAIGCGEARSMSFLSEQIRNFRQLHPLVQFSIHSAIADDITERIEKGILDMGLLADVPLLMVKYGVGIALCFDLGAIYDDDLCFVPLAPALKTGSVLVWKKNQTMGEAVTHFIGFVKNAI